MGPFGPGHPGAPDPERGIRAKEFRPMKRSMAAALGVALVVGSATAQETKKAAPAPAPKAAGPELKDLKAKASYSIGLNMARNLKAQSIDLDPDLIARGIKDGLAGNPALTDAQVQEALTAFQQQAMAQQAEVQKAAAGKNLKASQEFLAANKQKPGVKTTASGLQYKVLKEGTGASPKATDTVKVNYRGTLLDGTEFDASAKHGGPAQFQVNQVIPGWTEALQLMKVGSKYQLFIPPDLAYGQRGAPPAIGPNSALIFDVELLGVQ
jgi:FKBP-type peptidyl-prolyl cis-trans isomerase FklB